MPSASFHRIAFFDNLKGFLILLVLAGHFFQDYPSIRWPIYAFHMPLFVFISGYFSKSLYVGGRYRAEKPLGILFLYLGASILSCWVQGRLVPSFVRPQWGLWYLLALFVWYLLAPLAEAIRNRWALAAALVLFIVLVKETTISATRSWMYILEYFPFFLLGCLVPPGILNVWTAKRLLKPQLNTWSLFFGAILLAFFLIRSEPAWSIFVHYDMPLGFAGVGDFNAWFVRLFLLAPLLSAIAMALMPRCRLPLAFLGERTLQIYIFHVILWPWEWQTRQWLVSFLGGKAASLVAMSIWLCVFLLPFWNIPLKYLQTLPSNLLPVRSR